MAYRPSEKYGLGRRNKNASSLTDPTASNTDDTSDVDFSFNSDESAKKVTSEKPIFIIFNPKSLNISAEELNAHDLWTRKLTGLQLGSTFLKEYDINIAVETITREESEEPRPKPYDKQIICFTIITGGLLTDLFTALKEYIPDTIITIGVHVQDINLIKHEMAGLELTPTFIIGASGTYLEKLEEQWSNLEQVIKEAERQLKVATRKLEALKYDVSKRPTSKSLVSDLQAQQAEVDTITQHLVEFAKRRKYYVTFNTVPNEDEDSLVKRIRNLYRVWQGEVAKRESMGNEHGVVDREEIKVALEKRKQEKLQKAKEQQHQVKLALEQRAIEQEVEKKKKEESIPRILGIRAW